MITTPMEETIFRNGPDRVVINKHGEAVSCERARRAYQTTPAIIFVRYDGWSLGAPKHLEQIAFDLWADKWTHFVRRPNIHLIEITEHPLYRKRDCA